MSFPILGGGIIIQDDSFWVKTLSIFSRNPDYPSVWWHCKVGGTFESGSRGQDRAIVSGNNNILPHYFLKAPYMKQSFFKVKGIIKNDDSQSEDDFSIFIKAIDDRHAVQQVREYLRIQAPNLNGKLIGRVIIHGIEKKKNP